MVVPIDSDFKMFAGADSLPVHVRITAGDQAITLSLYTNMLVKDFLLKVSLFFSISVGELCVRMIEETRIVRIDTQVFDKKNTGVMLTLKDLKVAHNSAMIAEKKDPSEIQQDEETQQTHAVTPDVIELDDTANWRTVIVNTELKDDIVRRVKVDLDWTL
jgi:hypothetical protein